jgi:hypothetical protein
MLMIHIQISRKVLMDVNPTTHIPRTYKQFCRANDSAATQDENQGQFRIDHTVEDDISKFPNTRLVAFDATACLVKKHFTFPSPW